MQTTMKQKGFTLIELLVVIAIIGILAAMVLVGLSGVRGRARDSTRKSDLSQIKRALEVYRADQTDESVPGSAAPVDVVDIAGTLLYDALVSDYIRSIPEDPQGTNEYRYHPDAAAAASNFALWAALENTNDQDIVASCTIGSFTSTPGDVGAAYNYCVTND